MLGDTLLNFNVGDISAENGHVTSRYHQTISVNHPTDRANHFLTLKFLIDFTLRPLRWHTGMLFAVKSFAVSFWNWICINSPCVLHSHWTCQRKIGFLRFADPYGNLWRRVYGVCLLQEWPFSTPLANHVFLAETWTTKKQQQKHLKALINL